FFFYLHCPPLDLHSFPTRRSSDLRREGHRDFVRDARAVRVHVDRAVRLAVGAQAPVGAEIQEADGRRLAVAVEEHGRVKTTTRRSEEHTSELQSRGHLVCRLLLEK